MGSQVPELKVKAVQGVLGLDIQTQPGRSLRGSHRAHQTKGGVHGAAGQVLTVPDGPPETPSPETPRSGRPWGRWTSCPGA